MTYLIVGTMVAAASLLVRLFSISHSDVETRVMRSLKARLQRGEDTPQRRILALSRMM